VLGFEGDGLARPQPLHDLEELVGPSAALEKSTPYPPASRRR
jgi:hypothetical protein